MTTPQPPCTLIVEQICSPAFRYTRKAASPSFRLPSSLWFLAAAQLAAQLCSRLVHARPSCTIPSLLRFLVPAGFIEMKTHVRQFPTLSPSTRKFPMQSPCLSVGGKVRPVIDSELGLIRQTRPAATPFLRAQRLRPWAHFWWRAGSLLRRRPSDSQAEPPLPAASSRRPAAAAPDSESELRRPPEPVGSRG